MHSCEGRLAMVRTPGCCRRIRGGCTARKQMGWTSAHVMESDPRQLTHVRPGYKRIAIASRATRSTWSTRMPVTSPARTALDFGCWYPTMTAVAGIDALAGAVEIKAADIELLCHRYSGRRGIMRARLAIDLFDPGAQSPKESWLRVVLVQAGLPRPQTQIPVCDEFGSPFAYLDMGWVDVKGRRGVRRRTTSHRSPAIHLGRAATGDTRAAWLDRRTSRRGGSAG